MILDNSGFGNPNIAGAGNSANNSLVGNSWNNNLDGRAGQDFLTGNAGFDTFVFRSGEAGGDVVADFASNGSEAGDDFHVHWLWNSRGRSIIHARRRN